MEFNSVCFVAARQVFLRAGLEIGLVPAAAAQAEARHGQHLLELRRLAGRAIDQRRGADLLDGFQLMTAGSTLIVIHGHGGRLANPFYSPSPHKSLDYTAKSGIISIKSSLCSPQRDACCTCPLNPTLSPAHSHMPIRIKPRACQPDRP